MQICENPFTDLRLSNQLQESLWLGIAGTSLGGWQPHQQPASLGKGLKASSQSLQTPNPSVAAAAEQEHPVSLLIAEPHTRMSPHSCHSCLSAMQLCSLVQLCRGTREGSLGQQQNLPSPLAKTSS